MSLARPSQRQVKKLAGVRGAFLPGGLQLDGSICYFFSDSDRLRRTGVTALIRETQGERTTIAVAESTSFEYMAQHFYDIIYIL